MADGKMRPEINCEQYISTELQRVYIDNIIISDHSYEAMGQ